MRSNLGIRRGYAAYVGSKGGLGILIKQLASEWAEHGIRVNGIAPTFIRTPLVDRYLNDPDFYNALVSRIPMGRVGETEDLAGLAVFLASPSSSFVTGQKHLCRWWCDGLPVAHHRRLTTPNPPHAFMTLRAAPATACKTSANSYRSSRGHTQTSSSSLFRQIATKIWKVAFHMRQQSFW